MSALTPEEIARLRSKYGWEVWPLADMAVAQTARIAELEAHVRKWPTLECPCCGEEGAWAACFTDGQATTCGCGGIVSVDGEEAHIILDEEDCTKCKERELKRVATPDDPAPRADGFPDAGPSV